MVIPGRSGADGDTTVYTFHTTTDFGFRLLPFLKFRTGPGLQWDYFTSTESPVTLQNGTDSATFYTPSGSSLALLFTVHTALEFQIRQKWFLQISCYIPEIASTLRRRYQASLSMGFIL